MRSLLDLFLDACEFFSDFIISDSKLESAELEDVPSLQELSEKLSTCNSSIALSVNSSRGG